MMGSCFPVWPFGPHANGRLRRCDEASRLRNSIDANLEQVRLRHVILPFPPLPYESPIRQRLADDTAKRLRGSRLTGNPESHPFVFAKIKLRQIAPQMLWADVAVGRPRFRIEK